MNVNMIPNTRLSTKRNQPKIPRIEAARLLCQEARIVLTKLRSGPPVISRGELVRNMIQLRHAVQSQYLETTNNKMIDLDTSTSSTSIPVHDVSVANANDKDYNKASINTGSSILSSDSYDDHDDDKFNHEPRFNIDSIPNKSRSESNSSSHESEVLVNINVAYSQNYTNDHHVHVHEHAHAHAHAHDVVDHDNLRHKIGPFAYPFIAVILHHQASGPHTLEALRSLHRLLETGVFIIALASSSGTSSQQSINPHSFFTVPLEYITKGVLGCKFEQTDAGADEAVEMAIADLLQLIIMLDFQLPERTITSHTIMQVFNTVFVTRNTFVHSPALCYHFEQVLTSMVRHVFTPAHYRPDFPHIYTTTATAGIHTHPQPIMYCLGTKEDNRKAYLILEFLINQLLHTPMNTAINGYTTHTGGIVVINGTVEAHALHHGARLLCLRLIQSCLRCAWGQSDIRQYYCHNTSEENNNTIICHSTENIHWDESILALIQDDLCFALLMIGQGIWAYQVPSSAAVPGMISIEVLSEVCSTMSTLWSSKLLRAVLTTQFECIFTGFYQRALSLLRRLPIPTDSVTFHANAIFDTEAEVILESLVDILCLNDHEGDKLSGPSKGTLENLFSMYDCNLNRSDVATGLIVELCRCCGGNVDEDGEIFQQDRVAGSSSLPSRRESSDLGMSKHSNLVDDAGLSLRRVPAHLRELCAEALLGSIKSLFRGNSSSDDEEKTSISNSVQTSKEIKRQKRVLRNAAKLFNTKPSKGIGYLVDEGVFPEDLHPSQLATFLRNGVVVGLDKRVVGEYLGEAGKAPAAGKSPPTWERDRFHKETLQEYCSSFHFENQTILDSLRMFLAAFRLPGEAQQIDRILQAFAESCSSKCEESQYGSLKLLSHDTTRATDSVYLLSFSIIMLNTDLHNSNIKSDRKMKMGSFVLNNTDYGRDITEKGYELPREYLESIYESIRDEPIRTEGEGANGVMTFERWKDFLRLGGVTCESSPSSYTNVTEIVVENIIHPIASAISGFWSFTSEAEIISPQNLRNMNSNGNGMLGAQGARHGMDLSIEMLNGLKNICRKDLFEHFYWTLCKFTGLMNCEKIDLVTQISSFVELVERQSAVVVIVTSALENGDAMGYIGWKCFWNIIFGLRDLKLLSVKKMFPESDSDILNESSRGEWEMLLAKGFYDVLGNNLNEGKSNSSGIWRALFGSDGSLENFPARRDSDYKGIRTKNMKSAYRKELFLWNEGALSDDDDDDEGEIAPETVLTGSDSIASASSQSKSLGTIFEELLVSEDHNVHQPGPVTGLETYEDIRLIQSSPRARVRQRLSKLCPFAFIPSETRFLENESVVCLLRGLVDIISLGRTSESETIPSSNFCNESAASLCTISPASEALAEVLLCEVALKNRDRIGILWDTVLERHYTERLSIINKGLLDDETIEGCSKWPGIEKCVTSLLRLCSHNFHRPEVGNKLIRTLKFVFPEDGKQFLWRSKLHLDKHLGEGLWRICRSIEGLRVLEVDGWEGLLGLTHYCATRGGTNSRPLDNTIYRNLVDDDPALQAFKCTHLMLNSVELRDVVPFEIVNCIRALTAAGERLYCPKLTIASLDLLILLHTRLQAIMSQNSRSCHNETDDVGNRDNSFWFSFWLPVVEGIAESSDSRYSTVRQHSLSLLTDSLIHGLEIPHPELCRILNISIPIAGQRIGELLDHNSTLNFEEEEVLIEFELCISVVFKPFLHHLKTLIVDQKELVAIWMSILSVTTQLLGRSKDVSETEDDESNSIHEIPISPLLLTTKELATEHLRNAILILKSSGLISNDASEHGSEETDAKSKKDCGDITSLTWNAVENMIFCKNLVTEWREL